MKKVIFFIQILLVLGSTSSTSDVANEEPFLDTTSNQQEVPATPTPHINLAQSNSFTCQPCRKGRDGRDGLNGLPGRDGEDGCQGPAGRDGLPGVTGPDGAKGDQGVPGKDGKDGINGVPGVVGKTGPQGPPGEDGSIGGRHFKECTGRFTSPIDSGLIEDCLFNKSKTDSYLMVTISSNIWLGRTQACSRWFVTFDGNECSPYPIDQVYYSLNISNGDHIPITMKGVCKINKSGIVIVGFNVGECSNGHQLGDALTGWDQVTRIIIEEL